jgi:antitoxin FitA
MTTLTIPLSDEAFESLRKLAVRTGLTPEELARRVLEAWLDRPRADFTAAAEHVLRKNAEMYRQLA